MILLLSFLYVYAMEQMEYKNEAWYASIISDAAYVTARPNGGFNPSKLVGGEVLHRERDWAIVSKELNGKSYIFIGFKGSDNPADVITDAKFNGVYNHDLKIYIHKGMNERFLQSVIPISRKLDEIIGAQNVEQVVVTGHSLGGGLAQILFAYFQNCQYDFERDNKEWMIDSRLYTFGSPQVFQLRELQEPKWVYSVHEQENAFHFVNHMDLFPLVNMMQQRGTAEVISKSFMPALKKLFTRGPKSAVKVIRQEAEDRACKDCEWKQWGEIYYFKKDDGWKNINYSALKTIAESSSLALLPGLQLLQAVMVYKHMPWKYRTNILNYVFEI